MNTDQGAPRIFRHVTAFAPILMSLAALAVVGIHVARFGAAREPDEGTAAHLWQLLMAAQVPLIAVFAFKWLRRAPREASVVLAFQLAAAVAAVAPVWLLGL